MSQTAFIWAVRRLDESAKERLYRILSDMKNQSDSEGIVSELSKAARDLLEDDAALEYLQNNYGDLDMEYIEQKLAEEDYVKQGEDADRSDADDGTLSPHGERHDDPSQGEDDRDREMESKDAETQERLSSADERPTFNVFVASLAREVTDDDLRNVLQECGEIISLNVVRDKSTGQSKGFAFVHFASEEARRMCLDKYKEFELKGRIAKAHVTDGKNVLFIGGVPSDWTPQKLQETFERMAGESIESVTLRNNFCFLTYINFRVADRAHAKLSRQTLEVAPAAHLLTLLSSSRSRTRNRAVSRRCRRSGLVFFPLVAPWQSLPARCHSSHHAVASVFTVSRLR